VVCDAVPLLTLTGAPILMGPSLNCTVPAAVGRVTLALNVTAVPWATDEAGDTVNLVLLGAGVDESATGKLPPDGGVVGTTPVRSNHTPMTATATTKALIASQCNNLPVCMMASLFCVPVTRRAQHATARYVSAVYLRAPPGQPPRSIPSTAWATQIPRGSATGHALLSHTEPGTIIPAADPA
jgi:hypothetical protein